MGVVEYLIARDGVPPRQGSAFDYLLAGDGVYLVAENDDLEVRVPVAQARIRGLPPVYPACNRKRDRLPQRIWDAIVRATLAGYMRGHEVLLAVVFDAAVGYQLVTPPQLAGPTRIVYRPPASAVLEIHSHGPHAVVFSWTDDHDEQGLRLYGVIGRLDADRPEVSLRVGAYGHFLPVLWEAVFDGDIGPFQDRHSGSVADESMIDGVRD